MRRGCSRIVRAHLTPTAKEKPLPFERSGLYGIPLPRPPALLFLTSDADLVALPLPRDTPKHKSTRIAPAFGHRCSFRETRSTSVAPGASPLSNPLYLNTLFLLHAFPLLPFFLSLMMIDPRRGFESRLVFVAPGFVRTVNAVIKAIARSYSPIPLHRSCTLPNLSRVMFERTNPFNAANV